MNDSIIAGTGDSRYLKSAIPAGTTWADALDLLRAGTFPIDFNGINADGFTQLGTPLNKSTLLTDALAAKEELGQNATLVDFLTALEDKVDHEQYYRVGDTYKTSESAQYAGLCTGSKIVIGVPVPKSLKNINAVTVSVCKGIIYADGGRVDSHTTSSYNWLTNYTVGAEICGDNFVKITISTSGTFTNVTQYRPLTASLTLTLTMA